MSSVRILHVWLQDAFPELLAYPEHSMLRTSDGVPVLYSVIKLNVGCGIDAGLVRVEIAIGRVRPGDRFLCPLPSLAVNVFPFANFCVYITLPLDLFVPPLRL